MAWNLITDDVASNIITDLYQTANSLVKEHLFWSKEFEQQLSNLHFQLPKVEAVLTAMDNQGLGLHENDRLGKWSWQFRDTLEAAEDVLDEIGYNEIDAQLHSTQKDVLVSSTFSRYKRKLGQWLVSSRILTGCKRKLEDFLGNSRSVKKDTANRLKEVVEQLDQVIRNMPEFVQLGLQSRKAKCQEHEKLLNAREDAGLEVETVFGREEEKQRITDWVLKREDGNLPSNARNNIHPFTIVGVGGMGKTTLARLVYNNPKLKDQFEVIMWVCVSTRFDVLRITKDVIQAINKEQILPQSLNALQETLKGLLSSKRFFLVLDDVWYADDKHQWDKLMAPLKFGRKGSKILVTTRMDSVAEMVANVFERKKEDSILILNGLKDNDYLQLFNSHAFAGSNPECHEDLKLIGGEISKKLGGCPLIAKVLGGQLNQYKHEYYWESILKEDISINADNSEQGFKAILRLSYQNLSSSLQRCFRFCSIFPQDFIFERDELIHWWIGSGLIPEKKPWLEDTGREYIDYLVRKSFFDVRESDGSTSCYVMHDLLHDLARSVSVEECSSIEGCLENTNLTETIRHLYISAEAKDHNIFLRIAELKKLRTLIIVFRGDDLDENHVRLLSNTLTELNSLRLLSLTASFSCKLPDVMGSLIHLRYLSIQKTTHESKLHWFPELVYKLYNLRVLRLVGGSDGDYREVDVKGLTNLINLRHLEIPRTLKDRIPYIGKLASLQGSVEFDVRKEVGHKITELKNLTGICELSIFHLEEVGGSLEAREVTLVKKENLRSLKLVWSRNTARIPEDDERIANELCPRTRLRELTVKGYNGKSSPHWMTMFSERTYFLTYISLLGCSNWSDLPDLTHLPLLKFLQIKDVGLVSLPKIIEAGSSSQEASSSSSSPRTSRLKTIEIKYCVKLENLHPGGFKNINSLKTLCIGECPNVSTETTELLPTELEHISIGPCKNLEGPLLNSLVHLTSLKELSMENCETITTLPTADVFSTLTALMRLKIKNCIALQSLGGLEALPSLNSLTIFGCSQLISGSSTQPHSNGGTNQVCTRNTNPISALKILNIDKESLLAIEPLRSQTTVEEIKIGKASGATTFQALAVSMRNLPSLKRLYICNGTEIVSLPIFPTSLESLHMCGCSAALMQLTQNGANVLVRSVEFHQNQCSDQASFMSDLEFDRSDLTYRR